MNRLLPRGGRRGGTDPGRPSESGGLVGGVAAAAMRTRNGPCCATFGPRSFARRRLGVSAKAANDLDTAGRKRGQKQKSPPRPEPGGL